MYRRRIFGGSCAAAFIVVLALAGAASSSGSAASASSQDLCFGRQPTLFVQPGVPLNGTSGRDVILGTSGPDTIRGLGGHDLICARGGADLVIGGPGHDRIDLGPGDDTGRGNAGNDLIAGSSGRDTIRGGSGRDILNGHGGADSLLGERGIDKCNGGRGRDRVRCELPDPTCAVRGMASNPSRLYLSTSRVGCGRATTLFDEYRNFPFSGLNGNSLSATISDGWTCHTPTATSSALAGYDSACFNTNGRRFYVTSGAVSPSGYRGVRIGMTRQQVEAAIGAPTTLSFEGACAFLSSFALPDVSIFYGWPSAPSSSEFAFGGVGYIAVGRNARDGATTRGITIGTLRSTVAERYGPDLRAVQLFSPTEVVLSPDRQSALQFTYSADAVTRVVVMKRAGLQQLEWCF